MLVRNHPHRITFMAFVSMLLSIGFLVRSEPAGADVRSDVEAKLVDTQKKAAPDLAVGKATCAVSLAKPAGKVAVGVHRCTVVVEGVAVPYDVTVRTGGAAKNGTYTMQNAKAVIDTKKLIAIAASVGIGKPASNLPHWRLFLVITVSGRQCADHSRGLVQV